MTRLLLTFSIAAASFTLAVVLRGHSNPHRCHAPCSVVLPDQTQEDEFGIDLGWLSKSTPVVDVYRQQQKSDPDTGWQEAIKTLRLCIANRSYTRDLLMQCMDDARSPR
jgi:hypothetical protein